MKKNFIIGAIAVVLILFAFASFGAVPKKAAGLSLFQYKSGYFTNYVETPSYQEKWTSSTKNVSISYGRIEASSAAKGTFKLYIQIKQNNKGSWKTIKTINANKNGTTRFDSPKFSPKDCYRFKLVNEGTKKKVTYKLTWATTGSKK